MKTFISILNIVALCTFGINATQAQTPNFAWSMQLGSADVDWANGMATDGSGNSMIVGRFEGTLDVGDTTLTSAGNSDILLAKYNNQGSLLWAVRAGGTSSDEGLDIATDAAGNSIITGYFRSQADFGDTTLTGTSLLNDIFIAKYDDGGNLLWAEKAGGSGSDLGYEIATDSAGNSFVTGGFNGSAAFGDTTLVSDLFINDVFVAKYDTQGELLWATHGGGPSSDDGFVITTDHIGNTVVAGRFTGEATFGNITLPGDGNGFDIFVVKYDANGNQLWATYANGPDSDWATGIATDETGNIFLTGYFDDTLLFDNVTLTNIGLEDVFLAKYDPDGNLLWATSLGGPETDRATGITTTTPGNISITGYFSGSAGFGQTTLTSSGGSDIFVTEIDGTGNPLWAQQAGGIADDWGHDIAIDSDGFHVLTGVFNDTAVFSDIAHASMGGGDIFIAQLETGVVTDVEFEYEMHQPFRLQQNYPNPFNTSTSIPYSIEKPGQVEVTIYNTLGQAVRSLVSEFHAPGTYARTWDGRDNAGRLLHSGLYFYRFKMGDKTRTQQMLFVK